MVEYLNNFFNKYKPIFDFFYVFGSFLLIIITAIYAHYTKKILKLSNKQLNLNYRPIILPKIDTRSISEISQNQDIDFNKISWNISENHPNKWILNLFLLQNISLTPAIEIYIKVSIIKKLNNSNNNIILNFELSSKYLENILPKDQCVLKIIIDNQINDKLKELFEEKDLYLLFEIKYQSIRNEIFISRKRIPIKFSKIDKRNNSIIIGKIIDDNTREIEFEIIDKNII